MLVLFCSSQIAIIPHTKSFHVTHLNNIHECDLCMLCYSKNVSQISNVLHDSYKLLLSTSLVYCLIYPESCPFISPLKFVDSYALFNLQRAMVSWWLLTGQLAISKMVPEVQCPLTGLFELAFSSLKTWDENRAHTQMAY